MVRLSFGKYNDCDIRTVPEPYLHWLVSSCDDTMKKAQDELVRRRTAEEASLSMIQQVIRSGYRELSKKFHPDVGGNERDMKKLNAAKEKLDELLAIMEREA